MLVCLFVWATQMSQSQTRSLPTNMAQTSSMAPPSSATILNQNVQYNHERTCWLANWLNHDWVKIFHEFKIQIFEMQKNDGNHAFCTLLYHNTLPEAYHDTHAYIYAAWYSTNTNYVYHFQRWGILPHLLQQGNGRMGSNIAQCAEKPCKQM